MASRLDLILHLDADGIGRIMRATVSRNSSSLKESSRYSSVILHSSHRTLICIDCSYVDLTKAFDTVCGGNAFENHGEVRMSKEIHLDTT